MESSSRPHDQEPSPGAHAPAHGSPRPLPTTGAGRYGFRDRCPVKRGLVAEAGYGGYLDTTPREPQEDAIHPDEGGKRAEGTERGGANEDHRGRLLRRRGL